MPKRPVYKDRFHAFPAKAKATIAAKAKKANVRRTFTAIQPSPYKGSGFPMQLTMTHRYNEQVRVANVAGSMGIYVLSTNGMYDPNITGSGSQPYYFDQLTNLYNDYVVVKSKIRVVLCPDAPVDEKTFLWGVSVAEAPVVGAANVRKLGERPGNAKVLMGHTRGYPVQEITAHWNASDSIGGKATNQDDLMGDWVNNPVTQNYFIISFQPVDPAVSIRVSIFAEVEYTAVWTHKVNAASS